MPGEISAECLLTGEIDCLSTAGSSLCCRAGGGPPGSGEQLRLSGLNGGE